MANYVENPSIVDRKARDSIANAIVAFISHKIDNWAFDAAIYDFRTDDVLCRTIRDRAWLCYCDCARYFNTGKRALPPEVEVKFSRWEMLLRTNIRWSDIDADEPPRRWWDTTWLRLFLPRPSARLRWNPFFPFKNEAAWDALRTKNLVDESGSQLPLSENPRIL